MRRRVLRGRGLVHLKAFRIVSHNFTYFPKIKPERPLLKIKDAIAEIKRCRIVDPARATMLEAQILGRSAPVNPDPTDNAELKAARAMFGLI